MSILVALVALSYDIASADHLPPLPVEENFDCETDEESYFEPLESSSTYIPTYLGILAWYVPRTVLCS